MRFLPMKYSVWPMPNRSNRSGISLLDALDLAASIIDERFPNDPETRVVIRDRFGEVFRQVGESQKAAEQFQMAVSLRRKLAGDLDPSTLISRSYLGSALQYAHRPSEAMEVLQSTLADQTKVLGAGHPDTIRTEIYLDLVLREMHDEKALEHSEKTFQHAHQALGPRHPRTLELGSKTRSFRVAGVAVLRAPGEPLLGASIGLLGVELSGLCSHSGFSLFDFRGFQFRIWFRTAGFQSQNPFDSA